MTPIPSPITNPIVPSFELGTLVGSLMGVAFIIAGIMTLLYLGWGGLEWIGSGGDKAGMESARGRITNALIGLTITAASWAIITLVTQFLGLPFPCLPIPSLSGTVPTCPVGVSKITPPGGTSPGTGSACITPGTYSPTGCHTTGSLNCCRCSNSKIWVPTIKRPCP